MKVQVQRGWGVQIDGPPKQTLLALGMVLLAKVTLLSVGLYLLVTKSGVVTTSLLKALGAW